MNGKSVVWIFLLLIACAIGFFVPVPQDARFIALLKVILFFGVIVGLLYLMRFQETSFPEEKMEEEASIEIKTLDGIREGVSNISGEGFGKAFDIFSKKYLSVVRTAMAASVIGLFFRKNNDLVLEWGEDGHGVLEPCTFSPYSDADLLGQVIQEKRTCFVSQLPSGFSFSDPKQAKIHSFIGVPLLFKDDVIGVLAVGSETEGDFSEADAHLLEQFSAIFMDVLFTCRHGLEMELEGKIYKIFMEYLTQLKNVSDSHSAITLFVNSLTKLFSFDRFTLCLKQGDEGTIHFVHGQLDGLNPGIRFPLEEGLNGWVLRRSLPLVLADISSGEYQRPRYFKGENSKHGLRSFIGIPLGPKDNAWGCFSLESQKPGLYGEKAKEILSPFGVLFELGFERLRMSDGIHELKGSPRSL